MGYKNYIFDLYATLIDIHTNQNTAALWRRTAAILDAYGAVYEPTNLRKRYRMLIRAKEAQLSNELGTDYPEADIGNIFKELLLTASKTRKYGIWGDPNLWGDDLLEKWCASFAYAFRVNSRIRFSLYPDTFELLDRLKRGGKHIYLLSNAQSLFTRPEMSELGLTSYFEDIYISSEHGMRKPEPRFMEKFLEENRLDERESVMIGNDISSDIMLAARCGVNAVLVNHDGYTEDEIKAGLKKASSIVPAGSVHDPAFSSRKTLSEIE